MDVQNVNWCKSRWWQPFFVYLSLSLSLYVLVEMWDTVLVYSMDGIDISLWGCSIREEGWLHWGQGTGKTMIWRDFEMKKMWWPGSQDLKETWQTLIDGRYSWGLLSSEKAEKESRLDVSWRLDLWSTQELKAEIKKRQSQVACWTLLNKSVHMFKRLRVFRYSILQHTAALSDIHIHMTYTRIHVTYVRCNCML